MPDGLTQSSLSTMRTYPLYFSEKVGVLAIWRDLMFREIFLSTFLPRIDEKIDTTLMCQFNIELEPAVCSCVINVMVARQTEETPGNHCGQPRNGSCT